MASNLFAGNPPPNVVKWIEENVVLRSNGWDFDTRFTSYVGTKVADGNTQTQSLIGKYVLADGTLGLALRNFLSGKFISVNTIPKSSTGEYHVTDMSAELSKCDHLNGYRYPIGISDDGINVVWIRHDTNTTTFRQQVLSEPGNLNSTIEVKESEEITFSSGRPNCAKFSADGKYLIYCTNVMYRNICITKIEMSIPFDVSTLDIDGAVQTYIDRAAYGVSGIDISTDGKSAVINYSVSGSYQSHIIKLNISEPYDFMTAKIEAVYPTVPQTSGVVISPDGRTLFASCDGGYSGKVYEFKLATPPSKPLPDNQWDFRIENSIMLSSTTATYSGQCNSAQMSWDETTLFACTGSGYYHRTFVAPTFESLPLSSHFSITTDGSNYTTGLYSPDGYTWFSSIDPATANYAMIFKYTTDEYKYDVQKHPLDVNSGWSRFDLSTSGKGYAHKFRFSPDGRQFIFAMSYSDSSIVMSFQLGVPYDLTQITQTGTNTSVPLWIYSFAVSPDGRTFVAAAKNVIVQYRMDIPWNTTSMTEISRITTDSQIMAILINNAGTLMHTVSYYNVWTSYQLIG